MTAAVFLERGFHLRQLFQGSGAWVLIDLEQLGALATAHFHGNDLLDKTALLDRTGGTQLLFRAKASCI